MDCEELIIKTSTCKHCDLTVKTEELRGEHTAALKESDSYSASCKECGLEAYYCPLCEMDIYRVTTAPKRHTYGADGKCSDCGE